MIFELLPKTFDSCFTFPIFPAPVVLAAGRTGMAMCVAAVMLRTMVAAATRTGAGAGAVV